MKDKIMLLWDRTVEASGPFLRKLLAGGRIASFLRGSLFVGAASTVGLYLALELFIPDELVLTKVNTALAERGLTVEAESIGYSIFLAASLENGTVRSGGKTVLTFGDLTLAPSFWSLLTGAPSLTVTVEDIEGKGGELAVEMGSGEEPCYHLEAQEAPLALLQALWPEIAVGGALNGTAEFCREKKLSGEFSLSATGVTLGGTVYGLALEKELVLGTVELNGLIKENKLDLREMSAIGDLDLQVDGKVTLNPATIKNSRLDLTADLREKKEGAVAQIPLLELALSRFKDPGGGYAMKISGNLSGPSVRRDTRANRPARTAKPDFSEGAAARPAGKGKERSKEKETEKPAAPEPLPEKSVESKPEKEPEKEPEAEKEAEKEGEKGSDDPEKTKSNDTEDTP